MSAPAVANTSPSPPPSNVLREWGRTCARLYVRSIRGTAAVSHAAVAVGVFLIPANHKVLFLQLSAESGAGYIMMKGEFIR